MSMKIVHIIAIFGADSRLMRLINAIKADPRHFQIIALSSLLTLLLLWSDFAPSWEVLVLTLSATLISQYMFTKIFDVPTFDFRSPLITGLSLCLLLKVSVLWLYPLAGIIAMASKFLIRWDDKHIFNPANAAIVIGLIALPEMVWISPGQWGSAVWMGFLLICLAIMVLGRTGRADISLFLLGAWFALLLGRALWLGDPLEIPIHNAQSGALLIFAFFMVSDPKTTPDHRLGRLIFAISIAVIAYIMQYHLQIREGLFYALFIVCCITPIIDYFIKDKRYQWRET